jgi:hypothetical protein
MLRLLLLLSALVVTSFAHAQVTVPAGFGNLYIPGGFDSNDNVQIVGEGMFRNSCYRPAAARFRIDRENKVITLAPSAYQYYGICMEVMLPYDRVMDLGPLEAGEYKVVQNDEQMATLSVKTSFITSADEHIYAAISQGFVFRAENGEYQLGLTGELTNSCMYLDHIAVTVEPNVVVVQPIAKMVERSSCHKGVYEFSRFQKLDLKPGRYLLHIRSMNAKAVNSLFTVAK